MGIFTQISNKKRSDREKHALKWKRKVKAEKKASRPPPEIIIEDVELFSADLLKNKLKNPKNNIKISNKKRRRLIKRLKHRQVGDRKKEDEEEIDAEMNEVAEDTVGEPETETVDEAESSQPSCSGASAPTSSGKKKKKRGGKRNRKGKGQGSQGQAQDVEMKDAE